MDFPENVPVEINGLSFQFAERFHCGSGQLCSGAGCVICNQYRSLWADSEIAVGARQLALQDQARAIKPIERFYYQGNGERFPVGKTLHEEFRTKGPNVKVLKTFMWSDKDKFAHYEVTKM